MLTTEDFIIHLFCRVDDQMRDIPKHPQSKLYPSEIVTIGLLFAIKGVGQRAFYRWLLRDYSHLFPNLPERTRLFRLLKAHSAWTDRFLAEPTILGVADSYGIEFIHPIREGRSKRQIGKKGKSNHRWIVGGKLCLVLNKFGLICGWDCNTANVHDSKFLPLIEKFDGRMIVLVDTGFHTKSGDPSNMKVCNRGEWNVRMLVETTLSMLTVVCHLKKLSHRVWDYFKAHLAYIVAAFNILVLWNGIKVDEKGFVHLSIAQFSL